MSEKKITESPSIADQVLFELAAPDSNGCFIANPYQIDTVTIYYIERNFASSNYATMIEEVQNSSLKEDLNTAIATACSDPTEANLEQVTFIKNEIELTAKKTINFYSDAKAIKKYGDTGSPAWLSIGNEEDYEVKNVPLDAYGNSQYGQFTLLWNPLGMRSGDYLIYWTWTPYESSPLTKITSFLKFNLEGATQLTTSIPTHFTKPEKYETLLERYLPDTYKTTLGDSDLSPYVLEEFNKSVAKGFTFLEDLTNQMVDLIDPNATNESFLSLLGNLFRLSLRSNDPTLWRRQIKRAVPLFKKKGTLRGLNEALAQAGISLKKLTRLWQVVSPYTYQEHFNVTENYQTEFDLSKLAILPIDSYNFELFYRPASTDVEPFPDWVTLSVSDYATFANNDGITTMTWIGATAFDPIALMTGFSVRVIYKIEAVPDQSVETHIRGLSLSDQRDERGQDYPLKNWNVRVMDEDDAMFNSVIPDKNPFYDHLVYGKIRTEFPYSENVYNMEEYNGSKRDSTSPCDIDKDFMDQCSGGMSSKFSIDVEIEDLSNERVLEAEEIINEFKPFHAQLHSLNILGGFDEYIQPPVEQIDLLGLIDRTEITLVDPVQTLFSRTMERRNFDSFKRESLANLASVADDVGTGTNASIAFFSPNMGIRAFMPDSANPLLTRLEVVDGVNAGIYQITEPSGNYAKVYGTLPPEPLDSTVFTFKLSQEVLQQVASATIAQDNIFYFYDANIEWQLIPIRTQQDVDESLATNAYQISISGYGSYPISYILSNGTMVLEDDGSLPASSVGGLTYSLLDESAVPVFTNSDGDLTVKHRGKVTLSGMNTIINGSSVLTATITDIRNFINIGNYVLIDGTEYIINGFSTGIISFYIDNYSSGAAAGKTIVVYERFITNQSGYFGYRGMTLTTTTDYEATLLIHGTGPGDVADDSLFKENFLILIGTNYYAISAISGTVISLSGPMIEWGTTPGEVINFTIYQASKELSPPASVEARTYATAHAPGYDFYSIDRRGRSIVDYTIETITPFSMMMMSEALNSPPQDDMNDLTRQQESITFSVKWIDEGEK